MSNLEHFYFVKNRKNHYNKIYFSFKHNLYKDVKGTETKFREVMISGTNTDFKNVDIDKDN